MSAETITIARPYAKAIFQYALEKGLLEEWSAVLHNMAVVARDPNAVAFLTHPLAPKKQRIELFSAICVQSLSFHGEDFIKTLAENRRLFILPDILRLYNQYKAEWEKTLDVDVYSAMEIPSEYQQKITNALKNKYKRNIVLNYTSDPALIGGAVIKVGDTVIDGSIKGRIERMAQAVVS